MHCTNRGSGLPHLAAKAHTVWQLAEPYTAPLDVAVDARCWVDTGLGQQAEYAGCVITCTMVQGSMHNGYENNVCSDIAGTTVTLLIRQSTGQQAMHGETTNKFSTWPCSAARLSVSLLSVQLPRKPPWRLQPTL